MDASSKPVVKPFFETLPKMMLHPKETLQGKKKVKGFEENCLNHAIVLAQVAISSAGPGSDGAHCFE